jgi:Tfp pilus assembly protein PilV
MIAFRARRRRRRGLTAVAVLVCLIIITMISGAVLKVGLARRQELRAQEHRLQAEWLAEAGIRRGLARSAADPAYTSETWEVAAQELDSPDSALVTITVGRVPGDTEHREIRAQADYPRDPTRRARHTRTLTVNVGSRSDMPEKTSNH